ncbi:hypothetical protein [Methylobacterium sp. CM6257]
MSMRRSSRHGHAMGGRDVLIDPATTVLHRAEGSFDAMVDSDKDTIKDAPTFKYDTLGT